MDIKQVPQGGGCREPQEWEGERAAVGEVGSVLWPHSTRTHLIQPFISLVYSPGATLRRCRVLVGVGPNPRSGAVDAAVKLLKRALTSLGGATVSDMGRTPDCSIRQPT